MSGLNVIFTIELRLIAIGRSGDGLRLFPPSGFTSHLDLFTSVGNETHIVWGVSGQISGQLQRFEILAKNAQGFYFNTIHSNGIYKFARSEIINATIGTNDFWRIGFQDNTFPVTNANRRLEVVDNDKQLRLTYESDLSKFTDFLANSTGNLQIEPKGGKVGINLNTDPTTTLDVNGKARIRNISVNQPDALIVGVIADAVGDYNINRLDFTGNTGDVLLGAYH